MLLDNALKYAAPNSMVSVDLVSMENCVLTVASPVEPISREDLKKYSNGSAGQTKHGP